MSIRLFNNSGGYIDLNAGGDGTAANTFTLPAETGTLLTSASNANFPAGSVLQVVSDNGSTETTTTSTSYVDVGLSVNITPSSTSSKMLVLVNGHIHKGGAVDDYVYGSAQLLRGATQLKEHIGCAYFQESTGGGNGDGGKNLGTVSFSYLDSPATTSELTYKVQFKTDGSSLTFGTSGSLTVMEIAA